MDLIYRGSVKDLYKDNGQLVFKYSNRYSIFDWGEMPNEIPQKGDALASMAVSFFEHLKAKGFDSHYLKVINGNSIAVKQVDVIRPEWKNDHYDYSSYANRPTHCLVPLEVIFRKHLGQGNSLEARLKKNPAYLADIDLKKMPSGATTFDPALIECSTKLETSDRYLAKKEISEMNIVSEKELSNLRKETQKVAAELEKLFVSFGVKLWDGKLEYAFQESISPDVRSLMLVDSIGPDELRLTFEGLPLSKEFLRQIYSQTLWSDAVKKAKDLAQERKVQNWKSICKDELKQEPRPLTTQQIEVSSLLYRALANEVAKVVSRPLPFSSEDTLKRWHEKAQTVLGK